MSGSAGGNRITRASVAKTVDNYINRILKKFPAFKSAKVSGSYNTSAKEDFGDIDLIVNLEATDKKNIKVELAKFLSALPDNIIVPFKSEKYKGKKYLNTGEIITILYPIEGQPGEYVQIDNIVSISDDEAEFKKEFLDYPAEIQGLLLGLSKVICLEEDPKAIFARMGIKNIPELEANQEYEFNLSSAGLTLRIVTLDNFKEVDRTEVWKTSNWSNIKRLFTNYKIDGSFEDLLNDISSKTKNIRSKNRIKGIFNSMVSIKSGEVGTPKGDNKQKSLDKVNNTLTETNLGRYLASLLLEQDQPTIALYPGKFKPPHKGHFEVVKKLLQNADQVVVLISPKTHEGITADESAAIWELYKQKLDGNVEVRISGITPVKDVYDFVENNPELTVYAAYGKGDEGRYERLKKYPNAKIFNAGSVTEDGEDISATNLRKAIRDENEGDIRKYLPDGIEVNDFLRAIGKETKEEPQPTPAPTAPVAPVTERKYQNQDDMFADYVLSREADVEDTAQAFNIPIPDVRYAFTVGNMVVMSDDMWDKLENKNHEDENSEISGPPMILNYDQDRYYLTYGSRILADYKKLNKIPKVLLGVLDLKGPKPWPLKEYSQGTINDLVTKFKQEKPNLGADIIKAYINRFDQIKSKPEVANKDITTYSWKELETIVDANQPKRIKAGKINDGEPSKDANLVYNQNGLRIYVGKTKNACIKYGNGYSFCISARGEDNLYHDYRIENNGTPYFVFDDTKSSEQDENGKFIDPTHLLVVFIHEYPELADDYNDDEETNYIRYNEPKVYYTVTTADNQGEEEYGAFEDDSKVFDPVVGDYPELKGLKDVFKPIKIDPKEKAEYNLERKYNDKFDKIYNRYGSQWRGDHIYNNYNFSGIIQANKLIDEFINNKIESYNFIGILKTEAVNDYRTESIRQSRIVKTGSQTSLEHQKKKFIEQIIIPQYNGSDKNHNIEDDWIIKYQKEDFSNPMYKDYFKDIKQLVDEYRNELSKLRLMKEGLERKTKLTESETGTIGEFVKYAIKNLEIQKPPRNLTFSYDNAAAKEKRSFGYFDPNANKIWVYCGNRNMADILRTLAHELVHRKQDEDGRINYESGKTGSEIENEANAQAGVLLRDFGKQHEEIYQ
jgi:cytidyltransferase-like protein